MDKETLLNQIEFVQNRITETEELVIQTGPEEKGYVNLIEVYSKWVDRLDELIKKLDNFDAPDLEERKFLWEQEQAKRHEFIDVIFKALGITAQIAVPLLGLVGVIAVAKLAYTKDLDLELCNGRIWGQIGQMFKLFKL